MNNTILVISDKPEQFNLAASRLRDDGYRLHFEKNIDMSLHIARTESPRLIISELAVPDIDGLELCFNLRNSKSLGSTPILLVGDLSKESSIVSDGLRCGATDYLQKPIDDAKLFEVCRQMASFEKPTVTETRSENLFDALIDNLSDAITIIDSEGIIRFTSPSTQQVLGNDPNELVGKRMTDLVHPGDMREVEEYFKLIQWNAGGTTPIIYRFRENNVSWKLIESVARPIHDQRFGSAVVITSREPAEIKFSLTNAVADDVLRRAIFDSSPVALATFSASGHFVEGNSALFAKLSHSQSELQNMSLSELIFPAHDYTDRQAIGEIFSGKRPSYEFNNGYLTPEGERVWGRVVLLMCPDHRSDSRFLIGVFDEPDRPLNVHAESKGLGCFVPIPVTTNTVLNFSDWKVNKGLLSEN